VAARVDEAKRMRISGIADHDPKQIAMAAESTTTDNFWNRKVSSVMEFLDSTLSDVKGAEARHIQLDPLAKRNFRTDVEVRVRHRLHCVSTHLGRQEIQRGV
jgi:hypothetical protein